MLEIHKNFNDTIITFILKIFKEFLHKNLHCLINIFNLKYLYSNKIFLKTKDPK